jgi:hypothetical protein
MVYDVFDGGEETDTLAISASLSHLTLALLLQIRLQLA